MQIKVLVECRYIYYNTAVSYILFMRLQLKNSIKQHRFYGYIILPICTDTLATCMQ